MSISRRRMLALVGGGTVLAAGTAGGAFLATRTPARALEPWREAGDYADPRKRALSYALLAPNPHNRQPWLVDLRKTDTVRVLRDTGKNLPETDPHDRQLTIGMGCFLELMVIAAAETGHGVEMDLFPEGEGAGEGGGGSEPVAEARFVAGAATPDPLFGAVPHRRSCKERYDMRAVEADKVAALAALADIVAEPERVATVRDLTWAAWQVEARTPRTLKESVDLMRIGRAEIEANPDGIDLGGPFLETLSVVGLLSREGQADPDSFETSETFRIYEEMLLATPAFAVQTTPGNTRRDQIEAGRRWLRLNLATTALGLSLHPVSQALQEYPEMAAHRARAHDLMAPEGHTVQMLGRLGYGPSVPPSPRWPLDAKIAQA